MTLIDTLQRKEGKEMSLLLLLLFFFFFPEKT